MNNRLKSVALALSLLVTAGLALATPISGSSVTVTSVTPGTTAAKLGKTEDAAHSSGDTLIPTAAVVETTSGGTSATDGDYAALTVNADGALRVQAVPNTVGGLTIFRSIDIDESEEEAKGSAGTLYSCDVINDTAATKEYLKIYDGTAASVTVGTTTPVITIPLPAAAVNQHITFGGSLGVAFSNGITIAATTGIADNDTGAPAANAVVVNCFYK